MKTKADTDKKTLSPEAVRALAEAKERRRKAGMQSCNNGEIGGPKGLEPTRYGDWERKGKTSDF